jgi:hypothetical protein
MLDAEHYTNKNRGFGQTVVVRIEAIQVGSAYDAIKKIPPDRLAMCHFLVCT